MIPAGVREWIPPRLLRMVHEQRSGRLGLTRLYPSWELAKEASRGYHEAHILQKVERATDLALSKGGTSFERDGHVFDHPVTPFAPLAFLLRVALLKGGDLSVLDFGGSLGSTYRQCRPFFGGVTRVHWGIVEQPHYVSVGRAKYETSELHFYRDLNEAGAARRPDVVLFSSVLQYLDDPEPILVRAGELASVAVLIDRTPETDDATDIFSVQVTPETLVNVRVPFRAFGEGRLARLIGPDFLKLADFGTVDPDMRVEDYTVRFRGTYFERVTNRQEAPL